MAPTQSTEMIISEGPDLMIKRRLSRERIIALEVLAVAITIFIAGIVLIAVAASDKNNAEKSSCSQSKQGQEKKTMTSVPSTTIPFPTSTFATTKIPGHGQEDKTTASGPTSTATPGPSGRCDFSEEAKRVGLGKFLSRVKATYYKLHPYDVYWDPDVTTDRIRLEFVAYDPTPSVIKNRTDTALALLKEINDKTINADALKPRERKALAQVKHYLKHIFGQPYDVNYYAGDWMLGPNLFCWQEICAHGYAVHNGLGLYHKPYNTSDVELIETKLKTHRKGILQYIENMKMGVRKGMIRSVEECEAGINTIKRKYLAISLYNSTGVLKAWFVQPLLDPDYYSNITEETDNGWKKTHGGKNVSETIKEYLVKYLGEPLNQFSDVETFL